MSEGAGVRGSGDVVVRGRIVTATRQLDDGVLTVRGERVLVVESFAEWVGRHPESEAPPFAGIVVPGLVDIHCHGGFGYRFDSTDAGQARGPRNSIGHRAVRRWSPGW